MDKKTILAVILCIGVWILWQAVFVETPKRQATGDGGTGTNGATTATKRTDGSSPEERSGPGEKEQPPEQRPEERLVSMETDAYRAVWTSRGAALRDFILSNYKERVEDKKPEEFEQENLVSTDKEGFLPFGIRFRVENSDFDIPRHTDWEVTAESGDEVTFRYAGNGESKTPVITKTYKIRPEKYLIDLDVELSNRGEESLREQIVLDTFSSYSAATSSGCMGPRSTPRTPVCMVNEELEEIDPQAGTGRTGEPGVLWTGINEQYFLQAMIPLGVDKAVCKLEARHDGIMSASLMYPQEVIPPGGSVHHAFRLYVGPKKLNILENVSGGAGQDQGNARLTESVDFGWFSFLCHPMLWLLKTFYGFAGNWGIAIIFLTIVVKIVLLPLTQKSMKSMREMAKLKPMMEDLKKKYGDDKQRLNQEMMNLYKVHKINPMGGCFPMLLQMPIWIALYRMLYSSVELYQTPFIHGWIEDLSYRDPYFILPVVLGATMFLQQKLSPTSADTQQAKIMLYAMPIFFTFIMLYLPAGLVLYIFVNSLLSIGHQLVYNRMTSPPVPAKASGKG